MSKALQGAPTALVVAASLGVAAVGDDEGSVALITTGDEPALGPSARPLGEQSITRLAVIRAGEALCGERTQLVSELPAALTAPLPSPPFADDQPLLLVVGSDSSCCALKMDLGSPAGGAVAVVKPKNASLAVDVVGETLRCLSHGISTRIAPKCSGGVHAARLIRSKPPWAGLRRAHKERDARCTGWLGGS